MDMSSSLPVRRAYVVEELCMGERSINWPEEKNKWSHLRDLPLQSYAASDVGVIIGANLATTFKHLDVREPLSGIGPIAILTPLGWTVMGELASSAAEAHVEATTTVEPLWIKDEFHSSEERRIFKLQQERRAWATLRSICLVDGHYVVPLLWKSTRPNLPNNRPMALKCFFAIESRCKKDAVYCDRFSRALEMYEKQGFARKLKPSELQEPEGRTWYLPYLLVEHPAKPDKPRLVFHASKKYKGRSLNDELQSKPNLLTPLVIVLTRFREGPVAVSMDVKKMFLQVKVPEEDQTALRYIYRKPGRSTPPETYQMTSQVFGLASSMTSCIYALEQTARDNPEFIDVAQRLIDCKYVDNYADSFESDEEAIRGCTDLIRMTARGGFEFTQIQSSSRAVLESVPAEARAAPTLNLDFDELPVEPLLGCRWNCETDGLAFKLRTLGPPPTSKREMSSTIGSFFDPLNILACVINPLRALLQEVWRREVEKRRKEGRTRRVAEWWDRKVDQDIVDSWVKETEDWDALRSLEIPRRLLAYPLSNETILQLHVFCDASKDLQAAVVYLRAESSEGVSISFVGAKSKVAGITRDTIPHAELKAARIGAGLERKYREALRFQLIDSVFWTDSEAVLHWIRGSSGKSPRYVSPHKEAIRKTTSPAQWRYVPSNLNTADDATRGVKAKDMTREHRFFHGPPFLAQPVDTWPALSLDIPCEEFEEKLVRISAEEETVNQLMDEAQSLLALKTAVAKMENGDSAVLTADDLHQALVKCVKAVQVHHFGDEVKELRAKRQIPRSSRLRKLCPYLDGDGLLRVEGRLSSAHLLSESQRHPIILPAEGHLTKLVILDVHVSLLHSSVSRTLFDVRATYWILRGRQTIRRILATCIDCKRRLGPAQQPRMAPLPEPRMAAYKPVFFHTGLDYLGPLFVTVKRSVEKRWVCLFTCLTTRAIHLELAVDLSAAAFLNAFAIFSALRGRPSFVYSDNGTNLTAGERELKEGLERVQQDPRIMSELAEEGISWSYNPPGAPHMGGAWERLVRSVKAAVTISIGDQPVKEDVLRAALAAASSLINGRPLTELGVDPEDLRPLTPNHFLIGRENRNMQPDVFEEAKGGLDRNRWIAAQQLIDELWRRWLAEYLPGLTERQKWTAKTRRSEVGDIVLMIDRQAPRGQWVTGEISRIFPGQDGEVRSVLVKVGNKEFRRPVTKLVLLRRADEE